MYMSVVKYLIIILLGTAIGYSQTNELLASFDFLNIHTNVDNQLVRFTSKNWTFYGNVNTTSNYSFGCPLQDGHLSVSTNYTIPRKISIYFSVVLSLPNSITNQIISSPIETNIYDSYSGVYLYPRQRSTHALVIEEDYEMVFLKNLKLTFLQFVILSSGKHIDEVYVNGKPLVKVAEEPIGGMLPPSLSKKYPKSRTNYFQFGNDNQPFNGELQTLKIYDGHLSAEDIFNMCSPPTPTITTSINEFNRQVCIIHRPHYWWKYEIELNTTNLNFPWKSFKSAGKTTPNSLIFGMFKTNGNLFTKIKLLYPYPVIDLPAM